MAKPSGTLVFDVETHQADLIYSMPPEQFVRLIGYSWNDVDVTITTDLGELREQILKASWVIGHNIHAFDLRAVFGIESNTPMQLADEGRVYDTFTHATLVHPAPREYVNRFDKPAKAYKPEQALKWYGLDEQAHQLGVAGKTAKLSELAFEFGNPEIKAKKNRESDGYGKIPVDDPRYIEYLIGDVKASRAVAQALLKKGPLNEYALREQRIASRVAAISSNGLRVDIPKAQARVDQLKVRRDEIMDMMVSKYSFPTEGSMPWRTTAGKEAVLQALKDHGVDEGTRPHWPRTPNGALQLGGQVLIELVEGASEEAHDLGHALAELMGQRSLAALALSCVHPDGFVHPDITMLQASGRSSTTEPGLTVWTKASPEKEYFIPDNEDHALLEIDANNADARCVAWMSGDTKYAERFEPGADGHLINAWAAWGKDVVGTDKHDPVTAGFRQLAKPGGHGWGYRIGPGKLSKTWKKPFVEAKRFLDNMNKAFPRVIEWQNAATKFAQAHGFVVNEWGRKMKVQKDREFTQAPALLGQSSTREVMMNGLLKMPHNVVRLIKAWVHDAFLFSLPKSKFEAGSKYLVSLMEVELPAPKGGQVMQYPMSAGPPGDTWRSAEH